MLDTGKWRRRRSAAETNAKETGVNLVKMMAIRNGYHRTPCLTLLTRRSFDNSSGFKFSPTDDQMTCFRAIGGHVKQYAPMDRLVCGDVGLKDQSQCGHLTVLSNRQVALLAPTRILALQHLRVLQSRMPDVWCNYCAVVGRVWRRKPWRWFLPSGRRHTLFNSRRCLDNLGLLVIDEEQRFGVDQREIKAVSERRCLVCDAYSETLQMSLSGMRDFS